MSNSLLDSFITYMSHFELADYLAFVWFILLSFLFLILGILLLRKFIFLSIMLIFMVLIGFFIAPFGIKYYFNSTIRHSQASITNQRQLSYSDTFILQGKVQNLSKKAFKICRVNVGFYKYSKKPFKDFFYKLKPYKKKVIKINKPLEANESVDFKLVLKDFKLFKDTNISAISECYR